MYYEITSVNTENINTIDFFCMQNQYLLNKSN